MWANGASLHPSGNGGSLHPFVLPSGGWEITIYHDTDIMNGDHVDPPDCMATVGLDLYIRNNLDWHSNFMTAFSIPDISW